MVDVLMDSGPIIALFDASDSYHKQCVNWLSHFTGSIITTSPALTEATHVLYSRIGIDCAIACVEWVAQALTIDGVGKDTLAISAIMRKYDDLPADYADAGLVALADRLGLYTVISVDKDFTVYRGAAKQPFRNLLTV